MKAERSFRLAGFGALFVAGLGCGTTVEAGLANAPSARRNSPPRRQHDVISNGPESCGDHEPGERYRQPPCQQPDSTDAGLLAPAQTPSGDEDPEKLQR
jgi:hypothetical protein